MIDNKTYEPIAIVGMGCRFPGGIDSPSAYWEVLKNGIDAISDVPKERWNHEYYYNNDRIQDGSIISPQGGFIDDVDCFDYGFFGISANEANSMDPQQRIALQVVWESFEQGGIDITEWSNKSVGVFMGAFTADYQFMQLLEPLDYSVYSSTGMMNTMLSNRISHALNFKGPSMTIDTACSASLTSIHQACRSLQVGDSDLAIGGGAMLMLIPDFHIGETKTGFLSKTGRCHSFSDNADGYVRSEGVGTVILKRLNDALRDNDQIQSVIIGSAINQDGHTHGIALPNGHAQKDAIRKACERASINPSMVSFVEAHGTGTTVGDPIEANSIGEIYGQGRDSSLPLYVGSCKSSIGHTESAAGVAGLIKAILCIQNEAIPANLHATPSNSNIPFEALNIHIPIEMTPISNNSNRLIAGVNSFGFGGSNGHVLIEKHSSLSIKPIKINELEENQDDGLLCLPISANSQESFKNIVSNHIIALKASNDLSAPDLCYTSANHRAHLNLRKLVFAENKDDLILKLKKIFESINQNSLKPVSSKKLFWIFSGLGGTIYGSSKELYKKEFIFRTKYDECNKIYKTITGLSMIAIFNREDADKLIIDYHHLQIAIFFHQISLVALYQSHGIKPDGIVGHSAGEFTAFHTAGVYTLEETLQLIHHRIILVNKVDDSGGMISIKGDLPLSLPLIKKYNGKLSVAAYNSSNSISVSGHKEALGDLLTDLNINQIPYKELPSNKAYHHKGMLLGLDFSESLALNISPKPSKIKLFSSITGEQVDSSKLKKNYWSDSLTSPVIFHSTIKEILKNEMGNCLFLELSDKPVLFHHVYSIIKGTRSSIVNKINNGFHQHNQTIASLYEFGVNLSWKNLIKNGSFKRLKTYPWLKTKAWHESEKSKVRRLMPLASPLLGTKVIEQENQWESKWSTEKISWLNQHKILGEHLLPAATYIELALSALNETMPDSHFILEDLSFEKAVRLARKSSFFTKVQLDKKQKVITIYATEKLYPKDFFAAARISYRILPLSIGHSRNIETELQSVKTIEGHSLYKLLSKSKYQYGENFQGITEFTTDGTSSICKIEVDPEFCISTFKLHPVILDIAFHSALACRYLPDLNSIPFQIPVGIEKLRIYNQPSSTMYAEAKLINEKSEGSQFNILLYNSSRQLVAVIHHFKTQTLSIGQSAKKFKYDIQGFCGSLDWEPFDVKLNTNFDKNIVFIVSSESIQKQIEKQTTSIKNKVSVYCYKTSQSQSLETKTVMMKALFEAIAPDAYVINCLALEAICESDVIPLICEPIVSISKTIADTNFTGKLWFVSQNAQAVSQDEFNPIQTSMWGIARVFCNQEYTENAGGIIDIGSNNDFSEIIGLISSESKENQLALRNGKWHKLRLNTLTKFGPQNTVLFGKNSPYLITGAFGSIGKEVVNWMFQKGARNFIFTTSRSFSNTEISTRSTFVKKMMNQGAKVEVVLVNLANPHSVRELKNQIPVEEVAGVIYCAGIVDDKTLEELNRESLVKVVHTKMIGAWGLHELFTHNELEHFVLFSSIGSCFPNRGMANYATGNAALDGLAHFRRKKGLPALSINWGAWKTGMVADLGLEKHFKKMGIGVLENKEGIAALETIFFNSSGQTIVQKIYWKKYLKYQKKGTTIFEKYQDLSYTIQPITSNNCIESNIELKLSEELADLLAMDISEIKYETSLTDLHIDSLSILVVSELIRSEWGAEISIDELKDNMSIADIKTYINLQKNSSFT